MALDFTRFSSQSFIRFSVIDIFKVNYYGVNVSRDIACILFLRGGRDYRYL